MKEKSEEIFALLAALLVLFTAMLNPLLSASLAIALLILYAVYRLRRRSGGG